MARFSALAVVAQTVAALLSEGRHRDEFPLAQYLVIGSSVLGGTPSNDNEIVPSFGVSVFPYRVSYNGQRRPVSPRIGVGGERFRPSVLLDLHLLVTAWASGAVQQMRLLAWAIRLLEDNPILTPGFLNRWGPGGEEVFGAGEAVELAPEALSLQDMMAIWEINKHKQQPSVGFIARMVAIDSEEQLPEPGIVRSRNLDYGVLSP